MSPETCAQAYRALATKADHLLSLIEGRWARALLAKAWRVEGRTARPKRVWPTNYCIGCRKPVAHGSTHGRVCAAEARRRAVAARHARTS